MHYRHHSAPKKQHKLQRDWEHHHQESTTILCTDLISSNCCAESLSRFTQDVRHNTNAQKKKTMDCRLQVERSSLSLSLALSLSCSLSFCVSFSREPFSVVPDPSVYGDQPSLWSQTTLHITILIMHSHLMLCRCSMKNLGGILGGTQC
jgi:hypothetical protein